KAELISIGDELLIGQTINTNAAWLGQQLSLRGIPITRCVTISDTDEAIKQAIAEGFQNADILILTGRLGPTKDDITKKSIAEFFQLGMSMHEETLERIRNYFEQHQRTLLDVHRQQAMVPEGTRVLF